MLVFWLYFFYFFVAEEVSLSDGKGLHCRGSGVRAVLGHREWIAYLLHQWFSSRRGGQGERMQGPGGSHRLQTLWEQLLDFYKVALWTWETDSRTEIVLFVCIKNKTKAMNLNGSLKLLSSKAYCVRHGPVCFFFFFV